MGEHKYRSAVKVRVVNSLGNLKGYDPMGLTRLPRGESWNFDVYRIGEKGSKGSGPVAHYENKATEDVIRMVWDGYRKADFEIYAERIVLTESERKLRGMRPSVKAVRPAKDSESLVNPNYLPKVGHLDALATGEVGEELI